MATPSARIFKPHCCAAAGEFRQECFMRVTNTAAICLFFFVVAVLAGCRASGQAKGPKTVPVRGKVIFARGGTVKALYDRQARIELESVDQPGVRAVGPIEEDGSFVVATI